MAISKGSDRNEMGSFDVCIVGSGPVGLALMLECQKQGLSVIVLEAEGEFSPGTACEASKADIADPRHHVPMDLAVCRAFGGTSWTWGGRCVAFDDIDFEPRPYMQQNGWPFSHDTLRPWYSKAVSYLGCGVDQFTAPSPTWSGKIDKVSAERLERWPQQPKRAIVYRKEIENAERLSVHLYSTVTGLDLGVTGQLVESVRVAGADRRPVQAKYYVLVCGGLETTRLLLSTQRRWPDHFGGEAGALGRYYMGHLGGTIANIVLNDGEDIDNFDFNLDEAGVFVRRTFSIDDETLKAEELQNITFWPDNLPFHDANHGSGLNSLIFLIMTIPFWGGRLVSEAIRLTIVGSAPRRYWPHILNILRSPLGTLRDTAAVVRDRFVSRRWKPGWLFRSPNNTYVLIYRAEHRPSRESAVSLSDKKDAFGLESLFINLRFSEEDASSVVRAHAVLDQALRAAGKGRLEYVAPESKLTELVLEQAIDGYHQIGTTRMGIDPATSVVGPDCKFHELSNLYIASSSVFPSSGQANPTLLATTLAVRLAHELLRRVNGADDRARQPDAAIRPRAEFSVS
jgi:choline dehydrogenase-like flavoprotein